NELTGSSLPNGLQSNERAATAIKIVAKELSQANGRSLLVSGSNDINIQSLVNAINVHLGSYGTTIDLDNSTNHFRGDDEAFDQFLTDAKSGNVDVAFFVNSNPLYDYFDNKSVEEALGKIKFKLSFADRDDETASEATIIAPGRNYLESWGDAELYTGYFTIVQPTINPVFDSRQFEESFLIWAGNTTPYHDYVKSYWETNILAASGKTWIDSLQEGFIFNGSQGGSVKVFNGAVSDIIAQIASQSKAIAKDVELELYQSAVGDGKQANNAYLLELRDAVSKVTWDNYVAIEPKYAESLGLGEKDMVEVTAENGYSITLPVLLQPGQAHGTVSIAVSYGRTKAGRAGNGVGENAFPFARLVNGTLQCSNSVKIAKVSGSYERAQTQTHPTIEGRNIIRETTFANYQNDPTHNSGNSGHKHKTYD